MIQGGEFRTPSLMFSHSSPYSRSFLVSPWGGFLGFVHKAVLVLTILYPSLESLLMTSDHPSNPMLVERLSQKVQSCKVCSTTTFCAYRDTLNTPTAYLPRQEVLVSQSRDSQKIRAHLKLTILIFGVILARGKCHSAAIPYQSDNQGSIGPAPSIVSPSTRSTTLPI